MQTGEWILAEMEDFQKEKDPKINSGSGWSGHFLTHIDMYLESPHVYDLTKKTNIHW